VSYAQLNGGPRHDFDVGVRWANPTAMARRPPGTMNVGHGNLRGLLLTQQMQTAV
jgi:hypothetical protein